MEAEVQQLVEMGATPAQARAALRQYNDVMQAAERFFEGKFDHIRDEDEPMASSSEAKRRPRPSTPDEDEGMDSDAVQDEDEDDDEGDFMDYDSDDGTKAIANHIITDVDPYSGIFFSKDRKEEVIEVEEEPEVVEIPEVNQRVKLMTQGQWMKGCPEGGEQSFLFSLYSQLSEGQCLCPQGCGTSVQRKKSDFFAIFSEFSTYIEHLRKIARQTCKGCHAEFCLTCGESVSAEKVKRPTAATDDDPLFHCSNLQGVILGVGLSMLEQLFVEQSQEPAENKEHKARTFKRRKMDSAPDLDDPDAVYYLNISGNKKKGGIGYAGDQKEDNTGQLEAQAIQHAKDEKIGNLLSAIRVYLPNLHREGGGQTSDYLVHPTALAHLRRRFNYICSTLLRNDSLADMSDRAVLYFELLHWLETISNHEALASMMAMPIMVVGSVKAVTSKRSTVSPHHTIRERTIVYEGSSSPRELLEAIAIQAQAALKGLEGVKPPDSPPEELTEEQKRMTVDTKGKAKEQTVEVADENQKLLDFCQRILATANAIDRSLRETKGDAFVDRLHASLPKLFTSSTNIHVDAGTTEESAQKAYIDWANRVRFEYCDLTIPTTDKEKEKEKGSDEENVAPHYKFYYNNEARMLANSDIPKRSLAIAKELAILTTNLPVAWNSSIFLRVDETRVDVIKALITGPEGTPYYNGCYLFDIFLGPSYNQSPPSVKYMTTNGGKFRFNPNLYADGKVCLSLLGTWSGPGWVSGRSTLLQVLISIQSMILCDEPYLNEPGWAGSAGTAQSRAYSANVRRMVVKTAMLGNLKNLPDPFGDVIRTHFRLKARSIRTQLDDWLRNDDGKPTTADGGGYGPGGKVEAGGSTNGFQKDVEEMKAMLTQLEANGV
ncbi:Baculoviral IAP repeat-containing protein 6 [Hypsizygus marmoreus]|uniref:Baculoviral IAP repeat-containing protein 6 n=1 Tax=Hypsizygus marmoreus TaxID=39966 RepID=A0A369JMM0_HYPMA|nr:Baculoviral IAP repeat-containing protein 6 [Hypsizygus marmoreus]